MRGVYRALVDDVGTSDACLLDRHLEAWHDAMVAHRASLTRLGFPPDGHPEWADGPLAEARRLWDRAVRVLGRRAWDLAFLHARVFEGSNRMRSP